MEAEDATAAKEARSPRRVLVCIVATELVAKMLAKGGKRGQRFWWKARKNQLCRG